MAMEQSDASCQRRIQRRAHRQCGINETINALNLLHNFCGDLGTRTGRDDGPVSAAQAKSLEFIEECNELLGPPGDITDSGALEALRVSEGYEDLPSSSTLGSFDPALVSLPAGEVRPRELAELWGKGGQMKVKEFISQQLMSEDDALRNIEVNGPRAVYTDPKLRVKKNYVKFLGQLKELGLVDFALEEAKEQVGIFFVKKKQNRLRLILDCRRSNHWFQPPEHVALTTGESLRRISLDPGERLYVCSADLANAFYTLSMPAELRKYFGLQRVKAKDIGLQEIDGCRVDPDRLVQPRVAVLPMGWAWALYWCQVVHERIAERSGLSPAERLQDFRVAPAGKFWHVQYVDNLHVMGTNKDEVVDRFRRAIKELEDCGLTVHEVEELEQNTKILGWEYEDPGSFRPSRQRIWRLRIAIRAILKRGRVSGHQLERLLGHIAFASLGKREMFSMLGESYTFVQRHRSREAPIWKSVRRELSCWERLSPLIVQDLACGVCTEVLAVDASEWGLGAVGSNFNEQEVKGLSGYNERWRFKSMETSNARQFTFVEDEKIRATMVEDVAEDDPTTGFGHEASVPFTTVDRGWKLVGRLPWKKVESMPVLESRATLFGVKHLMRNTSHHGRRMLILTDSMTSACAVSKGRAQTWKLRTIIQKISAHLLATGSSLSLRWIPSEWNPSDGPSRGAAGPSAPCRVPGDDTLAPPMQQPAGAQPKEKSANTSDCSPVKTACAAEGCPLDLGHRVGGEPTPRQEDKKSSEATASLHPVRSFGEASSSFCQQGHSGALREGVRSTLRLCSQESNADDKPCRNRLSGSALPRSQVHGGRGHVDGKLCHSGDQLLPSESQRASQPSVHATSTEGVEEALSSSFKDATAFRSCCPLGNSCSSEEVGGDRIGVAAEFLPVSPADRVPGIAGDGCGEAFEASSWGIQMVELFAASHRDGHSFEDGAVGRIPYLGPAISAVSGASGVCEDAPQSEAKRTADLQRDSCRDNPVPSAELGGTSVAATWGTTPVSTQTRGCLSRSRQSPSNNRRSSSTRQMADRQVSQELRERQPNHATLCSTGSRRAKQRAGRGKRPQQNVPRPALNPGRVLHAPIFLELFSGSGRLGRTIARMTGWFVLLWDVMLGPEYDLTTRSNQHMVLNWVRSGLVVGAHLGVPCNSFSRARDQPGGPPPLRSDASPLGLEGLRPGDALKVQTGNCLLRFSVRFMLLCLSLYVSCTLENPAKSRLWICPPMVHFLRRRAVQNVVTEFCAYGTAWRKSTRFIGVHINLSPVGCMRCIGSKRGLCLFTGCAHLPLCGQTASGEWKTKIAEPYPWKLCRLLTRCFLNHEIEQIARNFARQRGDVLLYSDQCMFSWLGFLPKVYQHKYRGPSHVVQSCWVARSLRASMLYLSQSHGRRFPTTVSSKIVLALQGCCGFVTFPASQFQHIWDDVDERRLLYGEHPLSQLPGAHRGDVAQKWARRMLKETKPDCGDIQDAVPGARCNGVRRHQAQAEVDFIFQDQKAEVKSAQLLGSPDAGWRIRFGRIRRQSLSQRTQPVFEFDSLYLVIVSPKWLHLVKHDLQTGMSNSTGEVSISRGKRRSWEEAVDLILEELCTVGNCKLVGKTDISDSWIIDECKKHVSYASQFYHDKPCGSMSESRRGYQIERVLREVDEQLHPGSHFSSAKRADWIRDQMRIEAKSAQLVFIPSRSRWQCAFYGIKQDCFDELLIAMYSPAGLDVFRHDGKYGMSSHGIRKIQQRLSDTQLEAPSTAMPKSTDVLSSVDDVHDLLGPLFAANVAAGRGTVTCHAIPGW
eukprot:Skav205284  [mRNA]  locus=scaffold1690:137803:145924:+ [translate_table: standard]